MSNSPLIAFGSLLAAGMVAGARQMTADELFLVPFSPSPLRCVVEIVAMLLYLSIPLSISLCMIVGLPYLAIQILYMLLDLGAFYVDNILLQ
jgi:hypothetical protein